LGRGKAVSKAITVEKAPWGARGHEGHGLPRSAIDAVDGEERAS